MLHIYTIGTHNGLRISDVLNLKVRALKIKQPTVREIKTGKRKRIYIPAKTRRKLIEKCVGKKDTEYIFTNNSTGKPYTRQAVWKAFKAAEMKTGNGISVGTHSMRKAYAQKLMRKGKSYKEIQAKLNHEQLGDTLRYLISIERRPDNDNLGKSKRKNERKRTDKLLHQKKQRNRTSNIQ